MAKDGPTGADKRKGEIWDRSRVKNCCSFARLPDPLFAGIVAALASGMPDYLEPATSPHHRQFGHSLIFAAALVAAMKKLYDWEPSTAGHALARDTLLGIGFGYLAHLGADATTAIGLPLIGQFN